MNKAMWNFRDELDDVRRKACTSHKNPTCAPAQAHNWIYDAIATSWDPVWVRLDRDLIQVELVT